MNVEKKNADLHLHTTASDGGYPPKQLVSMCKEVGLEYIAICDHDTVNGVSEAIEVGEKLGITVIPGIEFSTKESGESVHILGYGIDMTFKPLLEMLEEQQRLRAKRMSDIVAKFANLGILINEAEILKEADGGSIGRPHIAKVLIKMGVVQTVAEAFELYLGEGKPCNVKKQKEMTPIEAMDWIHRAKAIAVLAHPVYYNLDDFIPEWVASGLLQGIEVYHRDHNQDVQTHYENLVSTIEQNQNIQLLKTGGSDFHHEDYGRVPEPLGVTRIANELAHKLLIEIAKRND